MRFTPPLAIAALLVACSPAASDSAPRAAESAAATAGVAQSGAAPTLAPMPAVHPQSGLPLVAVTVSQNGTAHAFRAEVAGTPDEQSRGMMFRTTMGADEAMLFPMDPPRLASFWMKNTLIPLDMVFIGTDGRISNIVANVEPRTLEPRQSAGSVIAVLELKGGRAAELGIVPGAKVAW